MKTRWHKSAEKNSWQTEQVIFSSTDQRNYICPKYFPDSFPKKCEQTLNYIQNIPLMI